MNNENRYRLPAEWESQDAIALAWPHADTDWAYILDDVKACFLEIARAINGFGEHLIIVTPEPDAVAREIAELDCSRITIIECPTNDTWARDTFAITTYGAGGRATVNDFKFNGWGLKFAADRDNLITRHLTIHTDLFVDADYQNRLNFVLEGGSIESDGEGTLLTTSTCLLSPNRNGEWTQAEIDARLKDVFGARHIVWLDHGALEGDDTDSHIDTLARLCPGNTIVYVGTDDADDAHYEELKSMERELEAAVNADGERFRLVRLPLPRAIFDEDGLRLPATYANFLIGNGFVLMPTYGQPDLDNEAATTLAKVFPDRAIACVDCRALIRQHGSLHCVTMQFPFNTLNNSL